MKPVSPQSAKPTNATIGVTRAPIQAEISPSQKRQQKIKSWLKLSILAVATLVGVWLILTFIVGFTVVNGISMRPTLQTGNILIVWKLPQTWAKITHSQYVPKRSDVVIVDDTNNSGEQFVKRVIGLPGEQVNIANGIVIVYSSKYPKGLQPDTAPYGRNLQPIQGSFNTQIPDGQIFVLGDNRVAGASIDSRSSLGSIPSNYIVGQVLMRVYPFNEIKIF